VSPIAFYSRVELLRICKNQYSPIVYLHCLKFGGCINSMSECEDVLLRVKRDKGSNTLPIATVYIRASQVADRNKAPTF
jgi:hypothetical protein